MAAITIPTKLTLPILTLLLMISLSFIPTTISHEFSRRLSKKQSGLPTTETTSALRFFFHDVVSGVKPTAVRIASAATPIDPTTFFGTLAMIDDPLTWGPEMSSGIVGRAQGFYGGADQRTTGLLMAMNFVFTDGEFNGSTLSVLGRNEVASAVREMAIVGGSGRFRFGSGYALARTHWFDPTTGDAIVEYKVTVRHYY